jgi:serine/threonine-protein kinase
VKLVPDRDGLADRARAEIAAMSRLGHPNITRLIDCGWHGDVLAIVQELAHGSTLDRRWARHAPSTREVIAVATQVLDALAHAHARGVVHRDVKPPNVIVDEHGRARLIDFGIARMSGDGALTAAGDLIGTAAYMSPEQARGRDATPASDVWAAALIVYEGLSGGNPFVGRTARETVERVSAARVPRLRRVRRHTPRPLEDAVHAALSPDPQARPRADELSSALAAAPARSRRRRRAGAVAASGAAGLAGLAMGAPGIAALAGLVGVAALAGRTTARPRA